MGEGGREQEGVSHSIRFEKKEKREGGEGGDRGRAIEVAKEIHKSGSESLWLIIAKLAVSGKVSVF